MNRIRSEELVRQLVALPGPPGEEQAVTRWLTDYLQARGHAPAVDAKGNLSVTLHPGVKPAGWPTVCVMAHMDEIAAMVSGIDSDGRIQVAALGGSYPWKWGEGPMQILTPGGPISAVLSFGSIHTSSPLSSAEQARHAPLTWDMTRLVTGHTREALLQAGVQLGQRVVLAPERRIVAELGPLIGSYFLDDRADLAAWLLAIEDLEENCPGEITFVATACEEVLGEGALWFLKQNTFEVTVALEIGPNAPDAPVTLDERPTIWVRDSYSAMLAVDGALLTRAASRLNLEPQWQYLSRGGSDASCAASRGMTARPVTLALPIENSHGYEVMHREAPEALVNLLIAYLQELAIG